jgi:uncharacterized protein YndB with AHSA1/START domain
MSTSAPELATRSLQLTRSYAAPCEEVFRAWTEAGAMERWFAPSDDYTVVVPELELRVGGAYRIEMHHQGGAVHKVGGTYREIQPPRLLSFTWQWEGSGETLVTVELREKGATTEVVLTHSPFSSDEERDKHDHGWVGCLDRLARYLAQ